MMKYLVTGGAGFIGSNLVDHLIEQGHSVACLDINPHGYWNESAKNYVGDIGNYKLVDSLMKDIECVFHLAADVRIQDAIQNPIHCYETNVLGTVSLLEAARHNKVKNFVFSSTSAVYECDHIVQSEESAVLPTLNPYAASKYAGEDLCRMYSSLYQVRTTILRYFNVYGNRQHTTGQYAPVLGVFSEQNKQGLPLTITGQGKQSRDFVHVSDVVSANIAAEKNSTPSSIFNVGSGVSYSIKEIANMISENVTYIKHRDGEVFATRAIIEKIKKQLGWEPKVNLKQWIRDLL